MSSSACDAKAIASLIDHTRLRSFPAALTEYLAEQCNFDNFIILIYKKSFKPIMIHPVDSSQYSQTLRTYLDTAYILDPLYNSITSGNLPNISRLSSIASDSFESSEYFQLCYKNFNLKDEINLTIALDNDIHFVITLGRTDTLDSITRIELNRLTELYPIVNALVRQFWLFNSQEFVQFEQSPGAMKQAISTFGDGVLTTRERQIIGLILQGHSSKSISDLLNISVGTVKVHRKNIHSRLNTSCQSDIFTMFLQHLNHLDINAAVA